MFCVQGFLMILVLVRETEIWRRAYHLHLYEILDEFYYLYHNKDDNVVHDSFWDQILAHSYENEFGTVETADQEGNGSSTNSSGKSIPTNRNMELTKLIMTLWSLFKKKFTYYSHHIHPIQIFRRWIPLFSPRIYGEMEFRIMHTAFCENFEIQYNALPFDEYVRRVFEKYLIEIITIDPGNWVVIIALGLLNWYQETQWNHYNSCTFPLYGNRTMIIEELDTINSCIAAAQTTSFFDAGVLMVVINLIVFIFARHYEFKILARYGIHLTSNVAEYATVLHKCDTKEIKRKEKSRLTADQLKTALAAAKEQSEALEVEESGKHSMLPSVTFLGILQMIRNLFRRTSVLDKDDSEVSSFGMLWHYVFGYTKRPAIIPPSPASLIIKDEEDTDRKRNIASELMNGVKIHPVSDGSDLHTFIR